jgi:hypothetical protein
VVGSKARVALRAERILSQRWFSCIVYTFLPFSPHHQPPSQPAIIVSTIAFAFAFAPILFRTAVSCVCVVDEIVGRYPSMAEPQTPGGAQTPSTEAASMTCHAHDVGWLRIDMTFECKERTVVTGSVDSLALSSSTANPDEIDQKERDFLQIFGYLHERLLQRMNLSQSISQSINQPINESVSQSVSQSNKQRVSQSVSGYYITGKRLGLVAIMVSM